ncbi:uncharacterized protein F4822DRAFT_400047 [Hypoxylon trugodes]|uniref:uncharacterized protein n=1 Tax=Hypoxylon trugodes TaxID=326681 RepID=UPI00219FD4A5|nr:uncharacterized protein F4822DRAFT_400047 [Hypoxylon trugodes]KAI1389860.1 hypothetical protein F4822DRAFT_400047 [Hypoxylon trugodes]
MDDVPPPPYSETDVYSRSGRPQATRTGSNDDNVSVTASSSRSNTIYTPPDTPRESHYNFAGADDARTTTSAHSYFESRPASKQATGQNLVISLAITEDASPDDFPYPNWANEHDTTEQDWHTFLNYLIPDHSSRSNSHIVDRKLQAEHDAPSSPTGRTIAEAQLGQIKSNSDSHSQAPRDIDATIREWNDGFFGPRGVTIRRAPASYPGTPQMPSAERVPSADSQSQPQPEAARSRWNPFRPFEANSRGLRIGRLAIDGDRVSIGDSFEVDRNGVRWNGQSIDGSPNLPGSRPRGDFPPESSSFNDVPQGRGFGRGRGRGRWWKSGQSGRHWGGSCDRSSSSSSSSSSDSDSDSSIGSLPDWDDLKDTQLPVTKISVSAWLSHPEQPVTREMLKATRSEIKAAKNAAPPTNDPTWEVSRQAMRQEVRSLLTRFKDLKREQKKAAKAMRKERREQKKALKRERRDRRRAERREQKNHEREFNRAQREAGRNTRHSPGGGVFEHPISHMPPTGSPIIPGPSPPGLFGGGGPFSGGGPFGGGPGFGRGRGRGVGPFGHPHPPWENPVQHAQWESEQARANAQLQSDLARTQADTARAAAHAQADAARAQAQAQADRALRAADAARAEAAAAVAAWTNSRRHPFLSPSMSSLRPRTRGHSQTRSTTDASDNGAKKFDNKYEEADALEAQMVVKANELLALRERIEREEAEAEAARIASEGGERGVMEEKNRTQAQRDAEALEREIDGLTKDVDRLRMEGDEEMARRMEKES